MNGTEQGMSRSHAISQAFVFLLLGVFAVFSTLMVLLSAQMYRGTVDQTDRHNAHRVLFSYVNNVVRSNDSADTVSVQRRGDVDMLVFGWDIDGERYETMVYCYDGALRELFVAADQEFEPGYGEVICEAGQFEPALHSNLLSVRVVDGTGVEDTLHIALRCSQEGAL